MDQVIAMDTKILAVAVVAIIAVAAVGTYVVISDNDKTIDMNIIGRVNTDGSGIIINATDSVDNYITIDKSTEVPKEPHLGVAENWIILHKDGWDGKVFTDPGPATIQHVQLSTIAATLGLEFVQYAKDVPTQKGNLYYVPSVPTYDKYVSELNNNDKIAGGIFWEPQSSIATISGKCTLMTVTNDLFPGHTCCTIAGQSSYMKNHEDETVRFLAAYIKAVDQMKKAIESGSGDAYNEVIQLATEKVAMAGFTDEQKKEAVAAAFEYVVYTYADPGYTDDPLADLKKDVANMAGEFKDGNLVRNGYSDLGFESNQELANKFVDSSYMKKALSYEKADNYDGKVAKIKVSVIGGDIHQLAIHYAMEKGIFAEYGLDITLSAQSNGPGVYTSLKNNDSQLGFIGAPPMVINSMNDKSIVA